jgi:predicted Zn-dependent protease
VGSYLAQNSPYNGYKFTFAITDSPEINAYSAPGGFILISRGALMAAKNEAALAGILAHEIAHVGRKHILSSIRSAQQKPGITEDERIENDAVLKARRRVKPVSDSSAGSSIARYLSGPNSTTISVIAATASALKSLFTTGLKPEVEFEADKEALLILRRSGYDTHQYVNFIRELDKRSKVVQTAHSQAHLIPQQSLSILNQTHPPFQARLARLEKEQGALKMLPPAVATGIGRYQNNMLLAFKTSSKEKSE